MIYYLQKSGGVMLRLFLLIAFLIISFSNTTAQNLILNPGCEDSLINGEIPYWVEVKGTDWRNRVSAIPPAYEGENMFFAGVSQNAELQQDVDVSTFAASIDSGTQYFYFEGYVRSYSQNPPDHSRLILKYLDLSKITVLDSIDLGENSNTNNWLMLSDTTLAPVGTRFIRICLISIRYNGTNNDGYFDGLSLTPDLPVNIENDFKTNIRDFTLYQNYPNPFNPSTKIRFTVPTLLSFSPLTKGRNEVGFVSLKVYDILGNEVATLVNEEKSAGRYEVEFNGNNLASGIYLCRMQAGNYVSIKKMMLLK
jgi:hypothetical protein